MDHDSVDLKDGAFQRGVCGGQMMVTGADDATMDIECSECGACHTVEPDYFRDGGVIYWTQAMVEFGEDL
ncbi:MAG: hypothetical protein R3C59_09900 [Planctomycetaceae bacterium]